MPGDAAVVEAWAAAPAGAPAARLASLLDTLAGASEPRTLAADDVLAGRLLGAARDALDGAATCPRCGARLDVTLELPPAEGPAVPAVEVGGRTVRLPTADDVQEAVAAGIDHATGTDALSAAAVALLERLRADGGTAGMGGTAASDGRAPTLGEAEVAALDDALMAAAPASPPPVELACPTCGHIWAAVVDLAAFAWDRIDRRARRLLGEVHRLASAYGWTHGEVLALPGPVRRRYLELVP